MGDFSRDPKDRLADSIKKRYVGVRMQQGVPILDSDWNEMEDLRKHELSELFRQFIGSGVPAGNDGFRIKALDNGGKGTIVLTAELVEDDFSSLEIDFSASTAASVLGFMPGKAYAENYSSKARLTGNASEPFQLTDGMTLTVKVNGSEGETVTFSADAFENISEATAEEVIEVINVPPKAASAEKGLGNDFIITGRTVENPGRILVEGVEALNAADIVYSSQPLYKNSSLEKRWGVPPVPELKNPSEGDREDIVYIDVWEREVDPLEDDTLIQPGIGVETAVRLKREWAVRVAEGADDLSKIDRIPGHRYLPLARLHRKKVDEEDEEDEENEGKITGESISDLRKRDLNLAKNLKTPIYLECGTTVLDAERYANIMITLKEILLTRLHERLFDFTYLSDYNQTLVLMAIQDIMQQCSFAAIQAQTGNFNNADGFRFLNILYGLQKEFVRVVGEFGNNTGGANVFINDYERYLEGSAPHGIPGLKPALENNDFISAAAAQESINVWLSLPVDVLPEGNVIVSIASVVPTSNLAYNVPFTITYEIESNVISPWKKEAYDISFETDSPSTWDINLDRNRVEVDALGGRETVTLTVTPRSGTLSTIFKLTATLARRSDITSPHVSEVFAIGAPPPGEEFFLWTAPARDEAGRVPIPQSGLSDGMFEFQLTLINKSDTYQQKFKVKHYLIPPEGQETDWHPNESDIVENMLPKHTVDIGDSRTDNYIITGPKSPSVGTQGTVIAEATLVEENGTSVSDGKSRKFEFTFIIT